MNLLIGYAFVAIVINQAHRFSPICLAWSNRAFRRHMLMQPEKFVLLPFLILLVCVVVAVYGPPGSIGWLAAIYTAWNGVHFCSQNSGVCKLYGGALWQQRVAFALTAVFTVGTVFFPRHVIWLLVAVTCVELMHWIMDLRLSSFMAQRQWVFTAGMIAVGLTGFLFHGVTNNPRFCGDRLACTDLAAVPILLGLDYAFGIWHFLMSRWVWSSMGRGLLA